MNQNLLQQHEKQMRSVLGADFTSYQIEAFEREIIRRVPSCYGNGLTPAYAKARNLSWVGDRKSLCY